MRFFAVAALLAAFATPALAASSDDTAPPPPPDCTTKDGGKVSDETLATARDILTTTKSTDRMMMAIDSMLPMVMDLIKKAVPDASADAMETFKSSVREELVKSLPGLVAMEACVYAKHFTVQQLHDLKAFYESPLGEKLLDETPLMMKENMAIGAAWGEHAGMAAMQRVLEKYRRKDDKT